MTDLMTMTLPTDDLEREESWLDELPDVTGLTLEVLSGEEPVIDGLMLADLDFGGVEGTSAADAFWLSDPVVQDALLESYALLHGIEVVRCGSSRVTDEPSYEMADPTL